MGRDNLVRGVRDGILAFEITDVLREVAHTVIVAVDFNLRQVCLPHICFSCVEGLSALLTEYDWGWLQVLVCLHNKVHLRQSAPGVKGVSSFALFVFPWFVFGALASVLVLNRAVDDPGH